MTDASINVTLRASMRPFIDAMSGAAARLEGLYAWFNYGARLRRRVEHQKREPIRRIHTAYARTRRARKGRR